MMSFEYKISVEQTWELIQSREDSLVLYSEPLHPAEPEVSSLLGLLGDLR